MLVGAVLSSFVTVKELEGSAAWVVCNMIESVYCSDGIPVLSNLSLTFFVNRIVLCETYDNGIVVQYLRTLGTVYG